MTLASLLAIAIAAQATQPAAAATAAASAPASIEKPATEGVTASIELDPKSGQRIYRAQSGDCEVRWVIQLSQAEDGAMRHHAQCKLPVEKQAPLYQAVLDRVLEDKLALRTLSWGRIDPDGAKQDHTLAVRLSLAAKKSKQWNSKTGRGAKGNDNKAVKEIANSGQVFVELEKIFHERSLGFEVKSIEKVLVLPAKKLPFWAQLEAEGVAATDRLPFDAQIMFAIEDKSEERVP